MGLSSRNSNPPILISADDQKQQTKSSFSRNLNLLAYPEKKPDFLLTPKPRLAFYSSATYNASLVRKSQRPGNKAREARPF